METAKRNYNALLWHAVFLSITATFTEVNTVIPALILQIGGTAFHVGIVSGIMIGFPLISKLIFTSFLSKKSLKRPYLLLGINLRIIALILIAVTINFYTRFSFLQLLLLIYGELLLFSLSGAFAGLPYIHIVGSSLDVSLRRSFFTHKQLISSIGMFMSVFIAQGILRTVAYPNTYVILFSLAAICLALASLGFWRIKEIPVPVTESLGYLQILRMIPTLMRENRNLTSYIWYSNIMSLSMALIPFFIAFAKDRFYLDSSVLSYVLIIEVLGMISSSILWPRVVKRGGFKLILYIRIILAVSLPLLALATGYFGTIELYIFVFFLIGWSVSAASVSGDAVIIEISDDQTRVLYSGIVGTMNLSIVIFPIILGKLIEITGFAPIFFIISMASIFGFIFVKRMICPVDRQTKPD